jgi:glycine cleavage system H protein
MADYLETTVDKFIFRVATDRLYNTDGVWVLWLESPGDGYVRVGLTDYLQQLNGDVAFAHIKPAGTKLTAGEEFAEIETIKATVSFIAPVTGEVIEVNSALDLTPELVNQDPYGKGWLAVIKAANWQADRARLLDPQGYFSVMQSQAQEELKKQ